MVTLKSLISFLRHGEFTDEFGILITATATMFNININIVGTSNTRGNPYTVIKGAAVNVEDAPTIWIGYYQDNTDQAGVVEDAHSHS